MNATPTKFTTFNEAESLGQFSRIPVESNRGRMATPLAASRPISPDANGTIAFSIQLSTLSIASPGAAPDEALAIGVLSQAAHDLRRFHSATNGIERELYLDAYGWITANDFSWPYSFVNICQSLSTSPEMMRAELLADASLGWFGHWIRLGERLSHLIRDSFIRVFTTSREADPPSAQSAPAFQRL